MTFFVLGSKEHLKRNTASSMFGLSQHA